MSYELERLRPWRQDEVTGVTVNFLTLSFTSILILFTVYSVQTAHAPTSTYTHSSGIRQMTALTNGVQNRKLFSYLDISIIDLQHLFTFLRTGDTEISSHDIGLKDLRLQASKLFHGQESSLKRRKFMTGTESKIIWGKWTQQVQSDIFKKFCVTDSIRLTSWRHRLHPEEFHVHLRKSEWLWGSRLIRSCRSHKLQQIPIHFFHMRSGCYTMKRERGVKEAHPLVQLLASSRIDLAPWEETSTWRRLQLWTSQNKSSWRTGVEWKHGESFHIYCH